MKKMEKGKMMKMNRESRIEEKKGNGEGKLEGVKREHERGNKNVKWCSRDPPTVIF